MNNRNPFETEEIKARVIRLCDRILNENDILKQIIKENGHFFREQEGFTIRYFASQTMKYKKHDRIHKNFKRCFDADLLDYFLSVDEHETYIKNQERANQLNERSALGENQILSIGASENIQDD